MKMTLDDKINLLVELKFKYNKDVLAYELEKDNVINRFYMYDLVNYEKKELYENLNSIFKGEIAFLNKKWSFLNFENITEIERHPIDIELIKAQAIIKEQCGHILSLLGIEPKEIEFSVTAENWKMEWKGITLFETHLQKAINMIEGNNNDNR